MNKWRKGLILTVCELLTVTSGLSPMWFTSMRTVTSDTVTHIISSTLTTASIAVSAVVVRGTYYKKSYIKYN